RAEAEEVASRTVVLVEESGSVHEDRSAAAEMDGLRGVEAGAAEVDEVEVDVVDPRAAEVGAAEGRLADLLGGLEVRLIEVVGVEAGPAPFAGDRAVHQPASSRAQVERRLAEVGVSEVRPLPVDLREAGMAEAGPAEVGIGHRGAGQQGVVELGLLEVCG